MRIEKVNSSIKRELANILQLGEVRDPRIHFVTILTVDVSKDLQHARVRFSTLGDTLKEIEDAKEGFESCKSYIRKLMSQRVPLRYTPEFQFFYDKGIKHAADIDKVLEEIKHLKKADEDTEE
jgi:ribosome-binding factor A